MQDINAVITGVGGYVPNYILDNEELSTMVDTSDEWIMTRIGVKTRHILKAEQGSGSSYLMTRAVEQLLFKTQVDPLTVEALFCATTTPDYHFPSSASLVISNTGLKNAYGFDLEAACAGFLYALEVGACMICSGRFKRIVIVGGDQMSSATNYKDRNTCPIFGDGAAAVLMEATREQGVGLIDSYLRADGLSLPTLCMPAGGSACPPSYETVDKNAHTVYQEGPYVFKQAVTKMSDAVEEVAKRNNLSRENITWLVPHQANVRIESAVARRLDLNPEQVMVNIDHMANTSAATLPLCLWEYEPVLKKGDRLIFTAFGAGFSWGASYMIWGYDGASEAAKSPAEFYKEGTISREEWYRRRCGE